MDNRSRKKNKSIPCLDEQTDIITSVNLNKQNNINTNSNNTDNITSNNSNNKHFTTSSPSTSSSPKMKTLRTTITAIKTPTMNSPARKIMNTSSHSPSSLSSDQSTMVTVKTSQNIDSESQNGQQQSSSSALAQNTNNTTKVDTNNIHSFSSTDSGRSSISSSQTSNGEEVSENRFDKTKVNALTVTKTDVRSDSHKSDGSSKSSSNNNSNNDNSNDGLPSVSSELDIYSDVTLIPRSTVTVDFTIKPGKKSTKRVNGRKPVKGIKTTIRHNVDRTKQNELKLHDELLSECELGTSSSSSYTISASKVNRQHKLEKIYPQTFKSKSVNNQLSFQDCSINADNIKNNIESGQESQQSTTPDLSSIPSLSSPSPSSTSPCSMSRTNHTTDKTAKENSSLPAEIQIRTPYNVTQRRKELFTQISNNISDHEGDCCELRSNTSDIETTTFNNLSISISTSNDMNELNRETKSEISSPLGFVKTTEITRSNSIPDIFDSSTPTISKSITTSSVLVSTNSSLRAGASNTTNFYTRSKSNYASKDTDHFINHSFATNRRKSRYNSNNNNNIDYSNLNLKSLLSNKYMKSFLMQPFLIPDYMNTSAYTTVNGYDLANLRKSFFNNEGSKQNFQTAAAAAAAALLPEPGLFINSPCYYWLPSLGFNNYTKNTTTTYTTDCIKLYNDKITNSNGNNSMNYVNGGNRYMLQQFANQANHGTDEPKSYETPKVSVSNDELNYSKRDSKLSNSQIHTNNVNKIISNPISRSMTKLNSLAPEDAINSDNFENRPSSAKDLTTNDVQSKFVNGSTMSIYKGSNSCNSNSKTNRIQSTTGYLNSDSNSDKLGSIKYASTESNSEVMLMNITNSSGQPISIITNPIQIDTLQVSNEDIMNTGRSGTVSSAVKIETVSTATTATTTTTTGLTTNYIPNPDSYLTAPTTFFYFYNNEGQLFALPSNALIFPTTVGRLGTTTVSNETAYSSPSTFITPQVNGNNGSTNCCNNSSTIRTTSCVSSYEVPEQLYSGPNYSTILKNTDNNQCRDLISSYSVPIQPSFLNGFHQWVPGQITLDNQTGIQQLQNSSTNSLVMPSNQGVILHPSCPFPLPSVGLIQPLISNIYSNQNFNSTSSSDDNSNRNNSSKQKNNQSNICSLMNRSTDQFKLRRFTSDLPSLLGNAKSTRSGMTSGKLINSSNNHSKYSGKGLMSTFLDDYNNTLNNQTVANRQKKHASKTNLYIRGLPTSFTEEELHTLAPDRKLIRSVKLIAGAEGEMYGFIDFVNNEAAKSALLHIKSGNRELYVNFAYESEKDPQNVYITNIPESWTASNVEDLKQIFQPYGPIATAIVMTKRSNNFCTGAGFVRFVRSEDAQRAIDGIRNAQITLENGKGPLEVKLADRQKPSDDQPNTTKVRSSKRNSEPPESLTSTSLMNGNEETTRHSRTRKQSDCLLPNDNQLSNHNVINSNQLRSNPGVLGPATDLTSWDVTNRLSNSDSLMLALRAAWASNSLQNSNFLLRNSIGQNNLTSTNENNRGLLPIPNQTIQLTNFMSQQKLPNGILHSQNPVQHNLVTGPTAVAAAAAAQAVTALLPFSRPIDNYSLSQALMHTPVAPSMIGSMIQPASNWTTSPLISNIYQSI
ncbi:RNA binding motif, single stranded interacting protein 3 [Schistosoma haematobium]|uniref:RNA binding motif, single stranded interacting protein 3 n=1 Tax=Schistosoma haematobium TaxID=6185 RepID=A0A922LH23_SCHHA|nr:RNA binding motif, single stranded interacting protein 3 [Schistosoma haematobium]KAH9583489.1 RNA binding motif, single stranded interacting protein 3 [Schistosoma haematobium]